MTEWIVAVVAVATLFLSIVGSAITATWIVARSSGSGVSVKQLSETKTGVYNSIDAAKRECGESVSALKEHVRLFELWVRDNLVRLSDFAEVENDLKEITTRLIAFGALTVKVDTMWAFQMRRAMSEAVEKGIGTMESPLTFTDKARASLDPIKDELIEFYEQLAPKLGDGEVLLEIEKKFGDRLLDLVCVPCGLSHGSCLLLAYAVAKKTSSLEVILVPVVVTPP